MPRNFSRRSFSRKQCKQGQILNKDTGKCVSLFKTKVGKVGRPANDPYKYILAQKKKKPGRPRGSRNRRRSRRSRRSRRRSKTSRSRSKTSKRRGSKRSALKKKSPYRVPTPADAPKVIILPDGKIIKSKSKSKSPPKGFVTNMVKFFDNFGPAGAHHGDSFGRRRFKKFSRNFSRNFSRVRIPGF